jgi:hypothetical protein
MTSYDLATRHPTVTADVPVEPPVLPSRAGSFLHRATDLDGGFQAWRRTVGGPPGHRGAVAGAS